MTDQNALSSRFQYDVVEGWEQLPSGWTHADVCDVDVDDEDRVYVLNRGEHPVIVYERDGSFVRSFGEGTFASPHGITLGPDGHAWCVDNADHTVRKFTLDGELVATLGTAGQPSDTGYDGDYMSVTHSGPPFHRPTKVCVLASGAFYVTDGYGNARVHRFSPEGDLEFSWGEPGEGPGQFRIPHGVTATPDEQRLLVSDRENDRIQIFDIDGNYVEEWTDVARPNGVAIAPDGFVFVAELGEVAGRYPTMPPAPPDAPHSRCSVFDPDGTLVARWGTPDTCAPGSFFAAHGICLDSHGDVYVAEVTWSAGGKHGVVPQSCHTLQKLTPTDRAPAPLVQQVNGQ
jgi:DNA-binding beta-propeller fold protein YncE